MARSDVSASAASELEPDTQAYAEDMWEALEITKERPGEYKVRWAGNNLETGKPWDQSWEPKANCSDVLVQEWKTKRREMKRQERKSDPPAKVRASKSSTIARGRSGAGETSSTVPGTRTLARPSVTVSAPPLSKGKRKRRSPSPNPFEGTEPPHEKLPAKRRRTQIDRHDEDEDAEDTDKEIAPHLLAPPRAKPKGKGREDDHARAGRSSRGTPLTYALPKKRKMAYISSDEEDDDAHPSVKHAKAPAPKTNPTAMDKTVFSSLRPAAKQEEAAAREGERERTKGKERERVKFKVPKDTATTTADELVPHRDLTNKPLAKSISTSSTMRRSHSKDEAPQPQKKKTNAATVVLPSSPVHVQSTTNKKSPERAREAKAPRRPTVLNDLFDVDLARSSGSDRPAQGVSEAEFDDTRARKPLIRTTSLERLLTWTPGLRSSGSRMTHRMKDKEASLSPKMASATAKAKGTQVSRAGPSKQNRDGDGDGDESPIDDWYSPAKLRPMDDAALAERGRLLAEARSAPSAGVREKTRRRTLEEISARIKEAAAKPVADREVERVEESLPSGEEEDEEVRRMEAEFVDFDGGVGLASGQQEGKTDPAAAHVSQTVDAMHVAHQEAANDVSVEAQPGTSPRPHTHSQSPHHAHRQELERLRAANTALRRENETLRARRAAKERLERKARQAQAGWARERAEKNREIARLKDAQESWEDDKEKMATEMEELNAKVAGVAGKEAELERLRADVKSVEKQVEAFRQQYAAASGFVDELRRENAELVQRAEIAEDRAIAGVATMKGVYEARLKKTEAEAVQWKLVHERDSRMGDEVRRRAGEWEELKVEMARAEEKFELVERENVQTRRLVDQLQARAAGARRQAEERVWDELFAIRKRMRKNRGEQEQERPPPVVEDPSQTPEVRRTEASPVEEQRHAPVVRVTEVELDPDEMVYLCRYRVNNKMCNQEFLSNAELVQHVLDSRHTAKSNRSMLLAATEPVTVTSN